MNQQTESANMLEMQMNEDIKSSFAGLAQWTYYSAIVGFISAGVSIVNAVSVVSKASQYGNASAGSTLTGAIIGLAISVIINMALLAASNGIRKGILSADQGYFNQGLSKLAQYFKIIGILSIIALVFLALILIVVVLSTAMTV